MKIFCKDIFQIDWETTPSYAVNQSVNLWLTDVATDPQIIQQLKQSLNEDELKRAERFAFEKDRNQFITAHGTLRNILAKYIDVSPSEIQFKKTAARKPFIFQPNTAIKFNISHSENKILIGVCDNEIGVDIEMIKDSFEFNQLSKTYFSIKEQKEISDSADQKVAFYKFWTRKEAVLKASGIGIADNLKEIEICGSSNYSENFNRDYFVHSFKIAENYLAGIASVSDKPLHFFKA